MQTSGLCVEGTSQHDTRTDYTASPGLAGSGGESAFHAVCELAHDIRESRSLASAGSAFLRRAPRALEGLTESAAEALIQAVALTGHHEAINTLSEYAKDPYGRGHGRLLSISRYFNPVEYGTKVLAATLGSSRRWGILDRDQLAAYKAIPNKPALHRLHLDSIQDLERDLEDIPDIEDLWIMGEIPRIDPILRYSETLRRLSILSESLPVNIEELSTMEALEDLSLWPDSGYETLDFLDRFRHIKALRLYALHDVHDLSPIRQLQQLTSLLLGDIEKTLPSLGMPFLRGLTDLILVRSTELQPLDKLTEYTPNVERISLLSDEYTPPHDGFQHIGSLRKLENLKYLDLSLDKLETITEVAEIHNLETIRFDCPNVTDLSPLTKLQNLSKIYFGFRMKHIDLSFFRDTDITIRVSDRGTYRKSRRIVGRNLQ